jgi:murein DD-endopeptidase MepM/ murein hydrolase activator NlpD
MAKGAAAQAVEVSAHPDRYANWEPVATTILAALTKPAPDAGAVPPTVPETATVVFPLPEGTWVLTSAFGWRVHPISGQRKLHAGADYSAPDGTAILAAADGKVVFAGHSGGYGNAIIIEHTVAGASVASLYGHMWDGHLHVKTGETVTAGQHIADVGSNGQSTGPHLHFEIRPDNDPAKVIDPHQWLTNHGATTIDAPATSPDGCYLEAS